MSRLSDSITKTIMRLCRHRGMSKSCWVRPSRSSYPSEHNMQNLGPQTPANAPHIHRPSVFTIMQSAHLKHQEMPLAVRAKLLSMGIVLTISCHTHFFLAISSNHNIRNRFPRPVVGFPSGCRLLGTCGLMLAVAP